MRKLLTGVILLAYLTSGCCPESSRTEPSYPTQVSGWQQRHERGLIIAGNFVLRKDQTTEGGRLRIKLVEVIAGDSCVDAGSERHQPRVTLQFASVQDEKVLCEAPFAEKGSMVFSGTQCGSSLNGFGIAGIYVIAVNVKDEWVFFELRG